MMHEVQINSDNKYLLRGDEECTIQYNSDGEQIHTEIDKRCTSTKSWYQCLYTSYTLVEPGLISQQTLNNSNYD